MDNSTQERQLQTAAREMAAHHETLIEHGAQQLVSFGVPIEMARQIARQSFMDALPSASKRKTGRSVVVKGRLFRVRLRHHGSS